MIQDIDPHRFDISYKPRPVRPGDFLYAVQGGKAVLREDGTLPRCAEAGAIMPDVDPAALRYLFSLDGDACRLLELPPDGPERPAGYRLADPGEFRDILPGWLGFVAITANHLASWYARNTFCGACGHHPMVHKEDERALECPACRNILYPAIAPAVIVGVVDGDRIVMTRYANRPFRGYALIAGFMEVGETLEDTVRREVMEEVGVRVRNLRYYKSQPWAFSSSLLVGIYADLDGPDTLTVDGVELDEALWFARQDIAPRPPDISLTSEMIETFRRNEHPR